MTSVSPREQLLRQPPPVLVRREHMVNNQLTVRKILDEQMAQKLWLSKGQLQRTKVGARTMIRESELQKVIEDGGKSPAPKRA